MQHRREALQAELALVKGKLARLYRDIEEGVVELDEDPRVRVEALKTERGSIAASVQRVLDTAESRAAVTPVKIEQFARLMRKKIDTGDIFSPARLI